MRFLFALTGFLFDLLVLATASWVVYCCIQPDLFFYSVDYVSGYLETPIGRMQVGGGALVFMLLSFRGLFLIAFRKGEKDFELKRTESGTLSVSKSTLENLVGRLSGKMTPSSDVLNLDIFQDGSGKLNISVKIGLDLSECNLTEYAAALDKKIRDYFENSLGAPIARLDVKAVLLSRRGVSSDLSERGN